MKLLFDHHLSPRLVEALADVYPQANHVYLAGLDRAADEEIWPYAQLEGYTIVTKDADFSDLVVVRGFPPKVVWLRLGNCTTSQIETALRVNRRAIEALNADPSTGVLTLF